MNAAEPTMVRPTPSAAAVVAALGEASRAGPPVALQWPYGLMAYRPRPRRETRVRVSVGKAEIVTPGGYKLAVEDLDIEVAVPLPSRSSIGVA
jgi:hypothetical protein